MICCGLLMVTATYCDQPQQRKPQVINTQMIKTDTTVFKSLSNAKVASLMMQYRPALTQMMNRSVGYTVELMSKSSPESLLSNFSADALLATAKRHYGENQVDFALTNLGGMRTDMPKGNVRLYDIYSIYPFENALVLVTLSGKVVKELFELFATKYVEALAGVRLVIQDKKVQELSIAGVPFDENRTYHLATLDFLLGGGDNMSPLQNNEGVDYAGITIRDAVLQYIATFTDHGEPIRSHLDERVVILP